MQQSNAYVVIFTAIMTVVVGGLLALTSQVLAPAQKKSIELDTKTQILGAVMQLEEGADVLGIYDERIRSLVVDSEGNEVTKNEKGGEVVAEQVNILKQYKKLKQIQKMEALADKLQKSNEGESAQKFVSQAAALRKDLLLPVYMFSAKEGSAEVDAYILPVYGAGLWDKIWGYIALDNSLQEVKGVAFDHKAETPGLGARISDKEIQERYEDKEIYNDKGQLVSVTMVKGENNTGLSDHEVDGMSGATMTAKGVNEMLKSYLECYQPYFKTIKTGGVAAVVEVQ